MDKFRQPYAAAEAFREEYQSVISRLTNAQVLLKPRDSVQRNFELTLSQRPAPLGRERSLHLDYVHFLVAEPTSSGRWSVSTTGYRAELFARDQQELIAYHWDTVGQGSVTTPHVHFGRALSHAGLPEPLRGVVRRLGKAHLPSGYVTLAEILRVAITDLGVEPLRDDWQTVLDDADRVMRAALPRT